MIEDYDEELDRIYICICGHTCKGRDMIDHMRKMHPIIHKEVCERVGIEEE